MFSDLREYLLDRYTERLILCGAASDGRWRARDFPEEYVTAIEADDVPIGRVYDEADAVYIAAMSPELVAIQTRALISLLMPRRVEPAALLALVQEFAHRPDFQPSWRAGRLPNYAWVDGVLREVDDVPLPE